MVERLCPYDFSEARSCPNKVANTWFSAWLAGHCALWVLESFSEISISERRIPFLSDGQTTATATENL